ncbi:MAG: Hsp33 family molecular chaperone HslO [Myxococcota bacterium]
MVDGTLVRAVVADGSARALRVDVTAIAEHGADLHGLRGAARELFVEGVVCAALLAAYLDEAERLTMQVQASEPRFAFTADVAADGAVRARLTPTDARGADRILGVMLVQKSVVGREVYRGATAVEHPSFAEMLHEHLQSSSQTSARIRVEGGIGAFVEHLPEEPAVFVLDLDGGPGDAPDAWSAASDDSGAVPASSRDSGAVPASSRDSGADDEAGGPFAAALLASLDALAGEVVNGLEGETQALRWECTCSDARVLSMLQGLGEAELQSMIDEDHGAVVTCNFCTRTVTLSEDQLRSLLPEPEAPEDLN